MNVLIVAEQVNGNIRKATAHAVSQTDPKFGESCDVCHGAGAEFDATKMHAGK